MDAKLPKYVVNKVKKLQNNKKHNNKLVSELMRYFERFDLGFLEADLENLNIVEGEIIIKDNKRFLKIEGCPLASDNHDGTFCHQVSRGEDWYTGELYFRISDEQWLQIFYEC